jgi:ferric-dicitrate binding protein FerR (iron transport regulator)
MMFAMLAVVATVVIVGRSMTPRNHTTSVRAYRTAEAMRSTVTLRGGSTMTLGPSSVATVAGDEITVVGQAYFSIVPDAKHPVVVRTANSIVRVLGTRFSVRQYPSERRSQVVVEEGRVALRSATSRAPDSAVVLAVNMLGVATDSGVTVSTDVSTERYAGWVKGNLSFNETQLADVIAELNRAYGSRIVIADSVLAQQRMYLNVSVSKQSLNTVLDLICDAANARYTRSGKQYVLTPGKGARDTSAPAPRNHTLTQPEKQYGR